MTITYRLYQPADLEQTLALVNRIFQVENPPIPSAAWEKLEAGDHVTVLAEEGGRIVGAIPFDLRTFTLRPGVSIRAAFAHCVGVDAAYRARGTGSGMMQYARQSLGRFCDGLFVYTGGEGHAPYTFYARNGFVDLHYTRVYSLTRLSPAAAPAGVEIALLDPDTLDGDALNGVYQASYPVHGGFPERNPRAWQRALDSIIYVQIPCDIYLAQAHAEGQLAGYCLFAHNVRGAHFPHGLYILELAAPAQYPGLSERLLQAVIATAPALGAQAVSIQASGTHPALPDLQKLGFQASPRDHATVIAGQLLDLEKAWARLAGADAPALHIWTPQRRLELPGSGPAVTLEMKEDTLQRLFLCREDLAAALQTERITSPTCLPPLPSLQTIFRPAPWVHHALDWI